MNRHSSEQLVVPGSKQKALIKHSLRQIAAPVHRGFRNRKCKLLEELIHAEGTRGTFLDVGGTDGMNGEFTGLRLLFSSVTLVNLTSPQVQRDGVTTIVADGCDLPFSDCSFDWVFSNAVTEHVGDWNRQRQFACEIRRVATKGYFVTTPNRYFPIEPHALLPLYQFYPAKLKKLALSISPGYMKDVESIRLLTRREMNRLFPDAEVVSMNVGSSLVAFHKKQMG